ncbi:glycerol-3-phosphate O-acyltransferase [Agrocybe pediades]|nr:glycerol-3-phosphate O-acyltransferase [Agrocybe pediades]
MELKLVYRILRKISDWTVAGYYSETYIEGQENVPKEGPLIITPTHHNEIIDIAALASIIPHRRHVSFWAKSTMFANPVAGAIMSSSGAIPVRRNPNNGSTASSEHASTSTPKKVDVGLSRSSLFRETSKALAEGQVVGVFPEGTSYTQASIVQIMPGAAWAAVEYMRYAEVEGRTGLVIVPVAIVYTDKSRYLSRIFVKYGKPISIDAFADEILTGDPDESSKTVVKKIMAEVETQLREMTINGPDWDTMCAVSMARSILWDDEDHIPLKDWVGVSQRLVSVFESSDERTTHLKQALTKYYALLHYAGIKHSILLSLLPVSSSAILDIPPPHSLPSSSLLVQPTISILRSLPFSLLRFVLFIPPLLLHFPGYITGRLAAKCLATPGEEESPAQFKSVGGGLGIGMNLAAALGILLQRLLTYKKLLSTFAFSRADKLTPSQIEAYSKPPLPAVNLFIKRRDGSSDSNSASTLQERSVPPSIPSRKLVRHLLHARAGAYAALSSYLKVTEDETLFAYLTSKGAKVPLS